MPILKRNGKTFSGTPTKVDTAKSYTTFNSADDKNPTTWSDVELLTSKEEQQNLFSKISTMFKNIRYLYKMLGTTNISKYSDGTVTGAIKVACDKADSNKAAIADANSKLGNTNISAIGDGTVTGGLNALNSNLENCFIISSEYADTVPSGTTNYYEPILTASIPDGYKLFAITGLRASLASIYFYSNGRRLTYNQIQIGLKSVDTSDLSGVVYLYRFIFIKENIISIH